MDVGGVCNCLVKWLLKRGFDPPTLRLFIEAAAGIEIVDFLREMAPQAGFEPATLRLTVAAGRFSMQSY